MIARGIGALLGLSASFAAIYPFFLYPDDIDSPYPELNNTLYSITAFLVINTVRVAIDIADRALPEIVGATLQKMNEDNDGIWPSLVSSLQDLNTGPMRKVNGCFE